MAAETEHLTIGRFAHVSGLSTKALRHYDHLGVLRPAAIDERTGYRLYAPGQLERAHQIRALRALKVPLGEIAERAAPRATSPRRATAISCSAIWPRSPTQPLGDAGVRD